MIKCPKCGTVIYEGDISPISDGEEYECEVCGAKLIFREIRDTWFDLADEDGDSDA